MDNPEDYATNPPPDVGVTLENGIDLAKLLLDGCNFSVSEEQMNLFDKMSSMPPEGPPKSRGSSDDVINKLRADSDNTESSKPREMPKFSLKDMPEMLKWVQENSESITPDGGIKKEIIRLGLPGNSPVDGQYVRINSVVYAERDPNEFRKIIPSGDKPYEVLRFKLVPGTVLPAYEIGVKSMKLLEKAVFMVKPQYGYGPMGIPDLVNKDSPILIFMELQEIGDGVLRTKVGVDYTQEEINEFSCDKVISICEEIKRNGNESFKAKNYSEARESYRKAVKILKMSKFSESEELERQRKFLYDVYNNMALSYINERNYQKGMEFAGLAHGVEGIAHSNKVKAYYRLALCYFEQGFIDDADKFIHMAKSVDPSCAKVNQLFKKIEDVVYKENNKSQETCKRMSNMFKHT